MLSAIREIGRLVAEQVIAPSQRAGGKIITIVLNNDNAAFQEIGIEDFDPDKADRYLYTDRGSKGNTPAPFAPLTEARKTFNKIRTWLSGCEKINLQTSADRDLPNTISQALAKQEGPILEAVDAAAGILQKKDKKFLTVKLEAGKTFLGDYEVFREAVAYLANEKADRSCSTGCICSICGKVQEKVSARTLVYQFDTDDKPGFIAGGFDKTRNWRNIPVCSDCRAFLVQGRKFIDSRLSFRFYGLNYCLIPHLLVGSSDVLQDIISILSDSHKSVSLRDRTKRRMTDDENEILEFLSDNKDNMALNFLFLQRQQSAERISLLIEDVFPSRIRAIFEAKDYVDSVFAETYNFGKMRTFFSKSDPEKRNNDLNKYFLDIVDAVFRGTRIDFSFLTRFHMDIIRSAFVKDEYCVFRVKDAMMNMAFLGKLEIMTFREDVIMDHSMFQDVFDRFGKVLNSPEKRGVFLLGALTQMLLNKQWAERGAKPFVKKLKSLKMSERDVKALLPSLQNKLEEYDAFDKGKRVLAAEAGRYMLEAEPGWKIPVDEINFFFSCGMNLSDEIATIVYKKEE